MNYFISALIITFIIPAFGIVMGLIRKIIYRILSIISPGFAFMVANYLTFPGVMHHELSHAFFGFITGAKIRKINLFKPQGMSLGNVEIVYRGPWLFRCIQGCLSAVGPVVMGVITSVLTYIYVLPNIESASVTLLIYYLLFSIIMHMTMSPSDMICFLKGSIGVYIIVVIACFCLNVDILSFL